MTELKRYSKLYYTILLYGGPIELLIFKNHQIRYFPSCQDSQDKDQCCLQKYRDRWAM